MGKKNPLDGVSLITPNSIANSLLWFLSWIELNNLDWHDMRGISESEIEIKLDLDSETLWLTQRQMAEVFEKDVRTVNEHLSNIYKYQEDS